MTERATILLAIKPEYAEKIYHGIKKYEYRKTTIRSGCPGKIVLYETRPVCRITGEIRIGSVLNENPETIWNKTNEYSGITKQNFDNYYKGKSKSVAYQIVEARKYTKARELKEYGLKRAPQGFVYLTLHDFIYMK